MECDILFCSSGSEARCTFIASKVLARKRSVAWVYSDDTSPMALSNQSWYLERQFSLFSSTIDNPRAVIRGLLEDAAHHDLTVYVDISSLTRELMAIWVYEILSVRAFRELVVNFVYSHAKYSEPPPDVGLVEKPTAIIPEFAGCFPNPDAPTMMIMGLGYEPHLSLSFLEFLEPQRVVVFRPTHHDPRYTLAIDRVNKVFMRFVKNSPLIGYDVFSPFSLFQDIESVISGNIGSLRLHIAPYGLKLFVVSSLLAASLHYPRVMVWHLNGQRSPANFPNRIATGKMSGLSIRLERAPG